MHHTTIHQPAPCHENWAAMTPTSAGRHCAACQTQVVDFTSMSDSEVVAFLHQHIGTSCGRFQTSQLSRPLLAAAPPATGWRRWLAATVALLGAGAALGLKAQAQTSLPTQNGGPVPAGVVQHAQPTRPATQPDNKSTAGQLLDKQAATQVLRGTVLDSATQQGLPGATVLLAGTTIGVSTNADGNFQLEVPAQDGAAMTEVVFSYLGYKTQRRPLPPGDSQPLAITLATDPGVTVSVGVIVTQRLHWYSPALLRYRARRLFRRE